VENIRINRELGDRTGLAFSLELFAQVATARQRPRVALRLAGAATALREAIGAPLSPSEKERLDRALTEGCRDLLPGLFMAFFEEGRRLPVEDAVAFALLDDDTRA
jgi:hypothetical protein